MCQVATRSRRISLHRLIFPPKPLRGTIFFSWRCLLLFCCLLEHRNTFLQTHVPKMDEESFVILQNEDSVQNWAVEFKFGEDIIYVPVSTETMERLKTGMLKLVLSFSVCV